MWHVVLGASLLGEATAPTRPGGRADPFTVPANPITRPPANPIPCLKKPGVAEMTIAGQNWR
jgi:hypothetical protein